mmetsp:Transcript_207/g.538  ORF Transcript_207/g.538 Transcript_207/m.538 type:complete len:121 (+) Transcript_207:918-1280(+)
MTCSLLLRKVLASLRQIRRSRVAAYTRRLVAYVILRLILLPPWLQQTRMSIKRICQSLLSASVCMILTTKNETIPVEVFTESAGNQLDSRKEEEEEKKIQSNFSDGTSRHPATLNIGGRL